MYAVHVGAEEGEINFYKSLGVKELVYAEPDRECLIKLCKNAKELILPTDNIVVTICPKACSSTSGILRRFNANGKGQSSFEEPGERVKQLVGDNFTTYEVETITLFDLCTTMTKGKSAVDYLCIDAQGHEQEILCSTNPDWLYKTVSIIDVELMTDTSQYNINANNWRTVVGHLLNAGFEPIIHPHGITESYLFLNPSLLRVSMDTVTTLISSIRDKLMTRYLGEVKLSLKRSVSNRCIGALGDHFLLPLSHVGGSIHAAYLQPFRELFMQYYCSIAFDRKG